MSYQSLVQNNPSRARLAGALLVAGMIIFTLGAFSPVPIDYMGPVAEQYVDVENDPTMWLASHVLYLIGIGLTAVGLYVLAMLLKDTQSRRLAYTAVGVHLFAFATFGVGT